MPETHPSKTPIQRYFYAKLYIDQSHSRTFALDLSGTPKLAAFQELLITNSLCYLDKRKYRIPHFDDTSTGLRAHLTAMNQRLTEVRRATEHFTASSLLGQLVQTDDDIVGTRNFIENTVYPLIEKYKQENRELVDMIKEIHAEVLNK